MDIEPFGYIIVITRPFHVSSVARNRAQSSSSIADRMRHCQARFLAERTKPVVAIVHTTGLTLDVIFSPEKIITLGTIL